MRGKAGQPRGGGGDFGKRDTQAQR
jgi:hypothetical protein